LKGLCSTHDFITEDVFNVTKVTVAGFARFRLNSARIHCTLESAFRWAKDAEHKHTQLSTAHKRNFSYSDTRHTILQ